MQIEGTDTAQNEEPDFFAMDDAEIMSMQPPANAAPAAAAEVVASAAEVVDPPEVDPAAAAVVVDPVVVDPAADPAAAVVVDPLAQGDGEAVVDPAAKPGAKKAPVAKVADPAAVVDPAAKKEETPAAAAAVVDYEAGYKKIMAPFKANGRDVTLQSPEEAVKLMQMGANYTKKMQALQPTLRLVRMLENNQLMDEGQLSYLIDLHQKKPEAIQKLLVESKFDPLSADVEKAATYVPGDHRVGDSEVQFQQALDEIQSTTTGPELIAEVVQQWDADSRTALFRDPRLLAEINNQKANGLYGLISNEIERRRILGDLQGVPFLAAYESVGKDLQAKGLLVPAGTEAPRQDPPVTRVVTPPAEVVNSERARAALAPKATPVAAKEEFNPLAQSDEEFLKSMNGRL